jgi:hypothetical protein
MIPPKKSFQLVSHGRAVERPVAEFRCRMAANQQRRQAKYENTQKIELPVLKASQTLSDSPESVKAS